MRGKGYDGVLIDAAETPGVTPPRIVWPDSLEAVVASEDDVVTGETPEVSS